MAYQRYLTPACKRFDPVELARQTEGLVLRHEHGACKRKYEDFYATGV